MLALGGNNDVRVTDWMPFVFGDKTMVGQPGGFDRGADFLLLLGVGAKTKAFITFRVVITENAGVDEEEPEEEDGPQVRDLTGEEDDEEEDIQVEEIEDDESLKAQEPHENLDPGTIQRRYPTRSRIQDKPMSIGTTTRKSYDNLMIEHVHNISANVSPKRMCCKPYR